MDPLSLLASQKKEKPAPGPAAPKATLASPGLFDVDSALSNRAAVVKAFSEGGSAASTVGELIQHALSSGTNVDFPMVTDICERIAKEPRDATEASRLLLSACAERNGPPRKKLKALTILNELMYDQRVPKEIREAPGAKQTLMELKGAHNTGLGSSADEQIRMFATEVEKKCFGSAPPAADPFAPTFAAAKPAEQPRLRSVDLFTSSDPFAPSFIAGSQGTSGGSGPTSPSDPFAPSFLDRGQTNTASSRGAVQSASTSADPFAPSFVGGDGQRVRKRDQVKDMFSQFGSAFADAAQSGLAAAQDAAKGINTSINIGGGGSRPENIPRLPVNPEAVRPALEVKFEGQLAGEVVINVMKQAFLITSNPFCETAGRLLVTNYRLKFQTPKGSLREELSWITAKQYLDVPLGAIEDVKIESPISEAGIQEWKLRVITKDFRVVTMLLQDAMELATVEEVVSALGQPGPSYTHVLFAFKHGEAEVSADRSGWELYDPIAEYSRMGVDTPRSPNASSPWTLCDLNNKYGLCDSYPSWLVQPRSCPAEVIRTVARFRKRARIPSMSWTGGAALGHAALFRSSQPTEGLLGSGCTEDEQLVASIRRGAVAGEGRDLLVVDLRPRKAAYANKVGGGGFEAYAGCNLKFGNIDNIHVVRDAWRKMGQAVNNLNRDEVGSWFKDVANSGWYDVMGNVFESTLHVVKEIKTYQCSVLIHCSDGWDRTAQVASMAMLCLDAHYRTLRGFLILIQKEFCSFGHRFRTRLGNGEKPTSEYGPIFLQWLELVYHLTRQFPTAFEFSESVLLLLAKEVVANRYGTFLTDSEKERMERVAPKTVSLWSAILGNGSPAAEYVNPQYQRLDDTLWLSPAQVNFKLWEEYWFRYTVHPREAQN